jgi:hypothetical protein
MQSMALITTYKHIPQSLEKKKNTGLYTLKGMQDLQPNGNVMPVPSGIHKIYT